MAVTVREAIEDLRRDVARWKAEIEELSGDGHSDLGVQLKAWIKEAERIIGKSEKPHA
jgi:hypothetical protein